MKYLLHAIIFSVLSMAIVGAWLVQQNIEAPYSLTKALAILGIVGAVAGLMIALASKYRRWLGACLATIYLIAPVAWFIKGYITHEVIGGCRAKVARAYNKAPNTKILTTWCVDRRLLERMIEAAENKNHRESFDWILGQGISHPNPDCARLGISVANYDLEETATLLAKGISPNCVTYHHWPTPLSKLFWAPKPNPQREASILAMLLDAGGQLTQDHLLIAIRSRNYYLLSEALKSIDPNFGFDHISDSKHASQIKNPIALAILKYDFKAFQMLIDAGSDTSRKVALSFKNSYSIDTYSLYAYAQELKKHIDHGAQRKPPWKNYLEWQQNINAIVSLLEPTDPFVAEAQRQRELYIAEQKELLQKKLQEQNALEAKRKKESYEREKRDYATMNLVFTILIDKERQQLFKTKPKSINDIKLFGGRLFRFERKRIEYHIYSEPSRESKLLFSKFENSLEILNADGSLLCTFEKPVGEQGSCYDDLEAEHSYFDGISYFKSYNDYLNYPNTKESWISLNMFNKPGWTNLPYWHPASDPVLLRIHKSFSNTIIYHPGEIVQAKNQLAMFKNLDKREVFERFDRQKYRLVIKDPTIHWKAGKAYISAGLATHLTHEEFCSQSKIPEIIDTVFFELFDKDGNFNIGKLDLNEGYCD